MSTPAHEALRDWLKRRQWTASDLARELQISRQRAYQLLDEGAMPSLTLATSIQDLTGIAATSWVEAEPVPVQPDQR